MLAAAESRNAPYPCAGTADSESRVTLVLTWWTADRVAVEGLPGSGPARHPPWRQPGTSQQSPAWPAAFSSDESSDGKQPATACGFGPRAVQPLTLSTASPRHVCPAWTTVGSEQQEGGDNLQQGPASKRRRKGVSLPAMPLPMPPLRFFLTSRAQIRDTYRP